MVTILRGLTVIVLNIVLIVKELKHLKEMINRIKSYFKKEVNLNVENSNLLVFKKGRGKKRKEDRMWGDRRIEEVKEFKHLGYHFQRNEGWEVHIRETVKKVRIAMVWGIGHRNFGNYFEERMFNSLYATEIWDWKEAEEVERIQENIRRTLGLDVNTSGYIEETKTDKVRIEER